MKNTLTLKQIRFRWQIVSLNGQSRAVLSVICFKFFPANIAKMFSSSAVISHSCLSNMCLLASKIKIKIKTRSEFMPITYLVLFLENAAADVNYNISNKQICRERFCCLPNASEIQSGMKIPSASWPAVIETFFFFTHYVLMPSLQYSQCMLVEERYALSALPPWHAGQRWTTAGAFSETP